MAKPIEGLPGNSGHIHISLTSLTNENLFARSAMDPSPAWPDIAGLSDLGRHFLAGLLDALPDMMPLLVPNVNSYKRLVENYWAPVHLSWGLEDRIASLRLICPPACKPSAARIEVRVPGADLLPHYALAAIVAAGWRGVQRKLPLTLAPMSVTQFKDLQLLPNSLSAAVHRFEAENSIVRELLGDEFVDYYAITRKHELKVWRQAVTDWYVC